MSALILNSRARDAIAWRLHGYTKDAAGIVCQVFGPEGQREQLPIADFAKLAGAREWDNRPEDIQAMLEFAGIQGGSHE